MSFCEIKIFEKKSPLSSGGLKWTSVSPQLMKCRGLGICVSVVPQLK